LEGGEETSNLTTPFPRSKGNEANHARVVVYAAPPKYRIRERTQEPGYSTLSSKGGPRILVNYLEHHPSLAPMR